MQLLVKTGKDHSSWKISPLSTSTTAPLAANVFLGRHPSVRGISVFWISKTNALLERLTHPKSCSTSPLGILKWHWTILPGLCSAITYLKFHFNLRRGLKAWSSTIYEQRSLFSLTLQWFTGGKSDLKTVIIALKMYSPATVFRAADTFFFWTPDSQKPQPFEQHESSGGACGMKTTEYQNFPL